MTFVTTLRQRHTNVERANYNMILLKKAVPLATIDQSSYPELTRIYKYVVSITEKIGDNIDGYKSFSNLVIFHFINDKLCVSLHKIKGKMYNDTLYVYKQNSIACTSFFFIRKSNYSQNILQTRFGRFILADLRHARS